MRRRSSWLLFAVVLMLVVSLVIPTLGSSAATYPFILGFKMMKEAMPDTVGDATMAVSYNGITGDAVQTTTKGTLLWQRATNWLAFCDTTSCWVNGPDGIQKRTLAERFGWEPAPVDPVWAAAINGLPVPQYFYAAAGPWMQSGVVLKGFLANDKSLLSTVGNFYDDQMAKAGWTKVTSMALPPEAGVWGGTLAIYMKDTWVAAVTYGPVAEKVFVIVALAKQP